MYILLLVLGFIALPIGIYIADYFYTFVYRHNSEDEWNDRND